MTAATVSKPVLTLMECTVRRDGGSKVHLGDLIYSFTPDKLGRHVALMAEASHIAMLEAVPESYINHGPIEADVPATAEIAPAARMAIGFATQPNAAEAQDAGPSLAEIIAQQSGAQKAQNAPAASVEPVTHTATADQQPTSTQPNANAGQAGVPLPVVAEGEEATEEQMAEIRAIFEAELGRKAHHKSNFETLAAQIMAVRTERAAATGA